MIPGDSVRSACGGRRDVVLHCVRGTLTYGHSRALTLLPYRNTFERVVERDWRIGHESLPTPCPQQKHDELWHDAELTQRGAVIGLVIQSHLENHPGSRGPGPIGAGEYPFIFARPILSHPPTNPPKRVLRVSCPRSTSRMANRSIVGPITTLMYYGNRPITPSRDQYTPGGPLLRHDDPVRVSVSRSTMNQNAVSTGGIERGWYGPRLFPRAGTERSMDYKRCTLRYQNWRKSRGGLVFCLR